MGRCNSAFGWHVAVLLLAPSGLGQPPAATKSPPPTAPSGRSPALAGEVEPADPGLDPSGGTASPAPTESPATSSSSSEPGRGSGSKGTTAGGFEANASGVAPNALHVGFRVGYGIPIGESDEDHPLGDTYLAKIPLWLDLGFKVTPNVLVGLYGQYAYALMASGVCSDDDRCSGDVFRFGVQAQYDVSPEDDLSPWIGLGIGYEVARGRGPVDYPLMGRRAARTNARLSGFEFLNLQGGVNFRVGSGFALGPFVSLSTGQYDACNVEVEGEDQECDLERDLGAKSLHQWVVFGARGTYEIWPF